MPTFVVAASLLVVLAGCSAQPQLATPTSTGSGRGDSSSANPTPHPTEVNPPGDVPDNQAFVAFTPPSGLFTLTVPEGWARTSTSTGIVFTDKLNSVEVVETALKVAPTVATVTKIDVVALEGSLPKFSLGAVDSVARPAGTAIHVTYLSDSLPNDVTGTVVRDQVELFMFWKNGHQVAVTLTSPQGADNVDPWNVVTKSFSWK
jgi:hypothetical protein